jgi:hypothetical protein
MKTSFSYIFWGLLFVILDVSINGFDLLPDGVGYVLVAIGCGGLVPFSPRFSTARVLSGVLAVLWLVGLLHMPHDAAVVFGVVVSIVNGIMIWMLLGGIMDLAISKNRLDLADRASNRRIAYIVFKIFVVLLGLFAEGLHDFARPLVVITVVAMLIILVMILHLIFVVRSELSCTEQVTT